MDEKVSIIILNWNGWKDTIQCVESLMKINYKIFNIFIVDNGSKDDSIEKIRAFCKENLLFTKSTLSQNSQPEKSIFFELSEEDIKFYSNKKVCLEFNKEIILIKNTRNFGFAEGNNIAIRFLHTICQDSPFILLLNNDTVVDPNFLREMISVAIVDKKIAIVGPKCYYYDFNGRKDVIWFAGGNINYWRYPFISHIREGEVDTETNSKIVTKCDFISGAALLISKWAPIKILDSRFFFGSEDINLCVKTQHLGYKLVCVSQAKIWHKVGSSRKKMYTQKWAEVIGYFLKNLKLIFFINKKFLLLTPLYLIQFLGIILCLIRTRIIYYFFITVKK